MYENNLVRHYSANECIAFCKTNDPYGGLSNMAPNYPICIHDVYVLTAEALYQACRFPYNPEIQQQIISQRSPIIAKEVSRQYMQSTRPDWEDERIKIMQWVLRAKLVCNWRTFGGLLDSTEEKYIVEYSQKDSFWGATKHNGMYSGINALGRLLMQLRLHYRQLKDKTIITLDPPKVSDFAFLGTDITSITVDIKSTPTGENYLIW